MKSYQIIRSILKHSWKILNIIREIVLNIFFLIFVVIIWGSWSLLSNKDNHDLYKQQGTLVVDIQGTIVDNPYYNEDFYLLRSKLYGNDVDLKRQNSLFDITKKIAQAANDKNITGMILKLDHFVGTDIPSLQYIGKYLKMFKETGKPIYAFSSNYNKPQYYLASFASKIYLPPQGAVDLYGFSTNGLYYKSLLDKLKVTPHIFRVGAYKSAVEPFIRDNMSDKARQNTRRWLNTLWHNYTYDIAINRQQAVHQLFPDTDLTLLKIKNANGNMADYARDIHLIDEIKPIYQFEQDIEQQFGKAPKLSIYHYSLKEDSGKEKPEIGVVFVNGTIADGDKSASNAGSYAITKQLTALRKNRNIRAVIIRINSPGGSVTASEDIRSEINALRKNNIPVVISMGAMAASGGYWIATSSDYILASANTITGSIGIFGIIPTFENALAKVGVHSDGVSTSVLAEMTMLKPLSEEYQQLIQMNINNSYHTFLSLVAHARKLTLSEVDNLARGQVWLGQEARLIGLVDKIGDFDDAIAQAAKLANLQTYRINWLKPESSWLNSFFLDISAHLSHSATKAILQALPMNQQLEPQTQLWPNLTDPKYRYSYCLNCADII